MSPIPADEISSQPNSDLTSRPQSLATLGPALESHLSVSWGPSWEPDAPKSEDLDLCGTDMHGNVLEPASPYSWLHRARLRLGSVRDQTTVQPASDTDVLTTVFCYGDSGPAHGRADSPNTSIPLPSWNATTRLVQAFFERAMVTYHFLHLPTVIGWLKKLSTTQENNEPANLTPQQCCIAHLVLSHGALYLTQDELAELNRGEESPISSEHLYKAAMRKLDSEHGPPTLESVQARLIQVHHLFSSARPNEAWYVFGTVVQLAWALGLHRATHSRDADTSMRQQLRRRTFWSIYSTDKYVSIAIGRPMLVHDDHISQELPAAIDDEDLVVVVDAVEAGVTGLAAPGGGGGGSHHKDCGLSATVYHSLLSRIVARGISEQDETNLGTLLDSVSRNQAALDAWRAALPPILSGQVHPSSLIPKFQRQAIVLRTFYLNAVILINRPLLVHCPPSGAGARAGNHHHYHPHQEHPTLASTLASSDTAKTAETAIEACLCASQEVAARIIQFRTDTQPAEMYWFTQSMTFNAISILYVYLLRSVPMQHRGGLGSGSGSGSNEDVDIGAIHNLAQDAHRALQRLSEHNAPSFRYCHLLDELRKEVELSQAMAMASRRTAAAGSAAVLRHTSTGLSASSLPLPGGAAHGCGGEQPAQAQPRQVWPGHADPTWPPPVQGLDYFDESFWPWYDNLSTNTWS